MNPFHAEESYGSRLIEKDLEVWKNAYFGGATNYAQLLSGILSFFGTARIDWRKITAASITENEAGTSVGGVAGLQTANDGNEYAANEVSGQTPGIDIEVVFTSVTAFNWVQVLARYQGSASHGVTIQLWNGSAWDTFGFIKDQPADRNFEEHSFFVPDDSSYINTGEVKVRFVHEMAATGNAHELFIDICALYQ
jgi:hypothetical protein